MGAFAGEISEHEAEEIIAETLAFRNNLLAWLKKNHSVLFSG